MVCDVLSPWILIFLGSYNRVHPALRWPKRFNVNSWRWRLGVRSSRLTGVFIFWGERRGNTSSRKHSAGVKKKSTKQKADKSWPQSAIQISKKIVGASKLPTLWPRPFHNRVIMWDHTHPTSSTSVEPCNSILKVDSFSKILDFTTLIYHFGETPGRLKYSEHVPRDHPATVNLRKTSAVLGGKNDHLPKKLNLRVKKITLSQLPFRGGREWYGMVVSWIGQTSIILPL